MANRPMQPWPTELTVVEQSPADALAQRLADDVAAQLTKALSERGVASLMVSGGSTPLPFFKALARKQLAWQNVTVSLVDERWVDNTHPDSNEKLVRDHLLTQTATAPRWFGAYSRRMTAEEHLSTYNQALQTLLLAHDHQFDVTVLGMGLDGHTASLFPLQDTDTGTDGEAVYLSSLQPGAPLHHLGVVTRPTTARHTRIGLSVSGILCSRVVMLHITGSEKRQVLLRALKNADPAHTPVSAVFAHVRPRIYWSH